MSPKEKKTSSQDYPQLGRMLVETSGKDGFCKLPSGLYIVGTPIGHLGDITLRALTTLASVDAIGCEDTRTSGNLLKVFGIKKPTFSYHDHNADQKRPEILRRIKNGEALALVSDAGMPAIADPGFKLVRDCRDEGLSVTVIPGANAAVTALASAGLPTNQFMFAGFLPPKKESRRKALTGLKSHSETLVFYEAPQRLAATLEDLAECLGPDRPAAVMRELTKLHEELKRGTLAELSAHYRASEARGEIVVLVGKKEEDAPDDSAIAALLRQRLDVLSVRDAVAEVAEMTGASKKEVYALALEIEKTEKK